MGQRGGKEGIPQRPAALRRIEAQAPFREVNTMGGTVSVAKEKNFLASLVFHLGVAEPKRLRVL